MTESGAGTEIKDYLGTFVANHADLRAGRVALQISAREMEILGESLVREAIAWAMGSKQPPYPECIDYQANFLADIGSREHGPGTDDEGVVVKFTFGDIFALGQFFALGMVEWIRGIQIARCRNSRLRKAILAKRAEIACGKENEEEDEVDHGLVN